MYCQYKCDACEEWHPLGQMSTRRLKMAWLAFYVDPPPPFTGREWLLIIEAELTRRERSTPRR